MILTRIPGLSQRVGPVRQILPLELLGQMLPIAFGGLAALTALYTSGSDISSKQGVHYVALLLGLGYLASLAEGLALLGVLLTGLYAGIGVRTNRIEMINEYKDEHIIQNVNIQNGVYRVAVGGGVLLGAGVFVANQLPASQLPVAVAVLAGLGWATLHGQRRYLSRLYRHTTLRLGSQTWLLTAKVLVLLASTFTLAAGNLTAVTAAGFLAPLWVGLLAGGYIQSIEKESSLGDFYTDSDDLADVLLYPLNQDLTVDATLDGSPPESAAVEVTFTMEAPTEAPPRQWRLLGARTVKLAESVQSFSTTPIVSTDDEAARDHYEEVCDEIAWAIYNQYDQTDTELEWDSLYMNLALRMLTQLHRDGAVDTQRIADISAKVVTSETRSADEYHPPANE